MTPSGRLAARRFLKLVMNFKFGCRHSVRVNARLGVDRSALTDARGPRHELLRVLRRRCRRGKERQKEGRKQLKLVRALLRPVPRLASRSSRTGRPFFPSLTVVILTRPKVLVGLDGAGKSTLLQTILGDAPEKTLPTFGFNNESTHRAGFDIDLYDLGGGKRIRFFREGVHGGRARVHLRGGQRGRGSDRGVPRGLRRDPPRPAP